MGKPANISGSIIEALYSHALVLSDEVRAAFALQPLSSGSAAYCHELAEIIEDPVRVALSTEGLRTTTRMMQVLAWLLNQRAYFSGVLTEFQLRRHGALPADRDAEPQMVEMLDDVTRALIEETQGLHARISRLDRAWREGFEMHPSAVRRLRERLGAQIGARVSAEARHQIH